MSTIAYRNGKLASDSGAWAGDSFYGEVTKIFCLRCGTGVFLVGAVGDLHASTRFIAWLSACLCCGEPDEHGIAPEDAIEAIVVCPNGAVEIWDQNLVPYYFKSDFYAIGNGRDFAIGAMAMGATAEEAVRVACQFDAHTQEPVVVYDIEEENHE